MRTYLCANKSTSPIVDCFFLSFQNTGNSATVDVLFCCVGLEEGTFSTQGSPKASSWPCILLFEFPRDFTCSAVMPFEIAKTQGCQVLTSCWWGWAGGSIPGAEAGHANIMTSQGSDIITLVTLRATLVLGQNPMVNLASKPYSFAQKECHP